MEIIAYFCRVISTPPREKMTSQTKTVLLAAGGIIAYSLWRKTQAIGTLNFYPASVKNIRFQGATPIMTIGIAVQNTSNQDFTLNSMAGNITAKVSGQSYRIGIVSSFTPVTINRNSQAQIFVDARLDPLSIVNDLINAITTGSFSHEFKLEGYVNVDNLQMPLLLTYKVGA